MRSGQTFIPGHPETPQTCFSLTTDALPGPGARVVSAVRGGVGRAEAELSAAGLPGAAPTERVLLCTVNGIYLPPQARFAALLPDRSCHVPAKSSTRPAGAAGLAMPQNVDSFGRI
jgi:hypothetical protein